MLSSGQAGSAYDGLIWFVLMAALGVYGWYAASLQPPPEEARVESGPGWDLAIRGLVAETAALERELTEAKERIAALEETLAEERQATEVLRMPQESAHPRPALASQVVELGGRQTEQGLLLEVTNADLPFPTGQSSLPPGDHRILDRIAAILLEHPTVSARVEGHTDAGGREEVNLILSRERAEAVREALVGRGVAGKRIETAGHGETRPIADNRTREGRDRNRRIEVYLVEHAR